MKNTKEKDVFYSQFGYGVFDLCFCCVDFGQSVEIRYEDENVWLVQKMQLLRKT